jgi:hypothetical protein
MPLRPGPPPQRRTRLKPGKPLRPGKPLKRRVALKNMSDKRRLEIESPVRAEARARVFDRDGRCLLAWQSGIPPCIGPMTVHHLRKAGQGGPYNELNLVTLCAGHNSWVETSAAVPYVHRWGLVMRRGDTYAEIWARLAAAGLVTYNWNGLPLVAT